MERENSNREMIIRMLRSHGHLTISEIARLGKMSRPTVYLHLDNLEKKGLINRKKNPEKKGAPVTIFLNELNIYKKDKKKLGEFLKLINKEDGILLSKIKSDHMEIGDAPVQMLALFSGLIDKKIVLTKKGKKYLRGEKK